ncbi:synaptotagmin-11 [Rhineura floridana]|uniref:synaptotagmin-11 n=1 Tax=Rhineura floridana TaxID=261503 RepID=UPI002AC86B4D|nr:synaptotagmin-11 [Rhineura floridana]
MRCHVSLWQNRRVLLSPSTILPITPSIASLLLRMAQTLGQRRCGERENDVRNKTSDRPSPPAPTRAALPSHRRAGSERRREAWPRLALGGGALPGNRSKWAELALHQDQSPALHPLESGASSGPGEAPPPPHPPKGPPARIGPLPPLQSRAAMAEIASVRPSFDVSPIVAGLIGATVLVVSVSVTVFVWTCCHQHAEKKHKTPPYKFIHMLKGISIYPETLSNKKKIIRIRRDKLGAARQDGRGNLLVDAAEAGLVGSDKTSNGLSAATCVNQLPIKVDYGEELSPDQSLTPAGSKTSSPSSLEEEVMLGTLTFSVDYNFPKKALVVTIQEAHGLPVMDEHNQGSDPYIKMTILPDKRHRVKTRVLRKTLDPVFDETFTFYGIPYSQLQDLVLHFLVLSFDRFSRDDVIGEVMVPLAGVDPSTGKVQLTREIIKRNIQKCVSRGELQVSLSYHPVAQRMTVVVLKARHLPKMDITGLSGRNPYVKVNVYYGRKRIAKKKTHVKKCTLNPVFNESFIYDIPVDLLPDVSIEFLVIDFDRTTKNEVVGRLILGAHSVTAGGVEHWREVCESPRKQIAKWHSLSEY